MTKKVIEQLQSGVVPRMAPISADLPKSLATKKDYRGINIFLLCNAPYDSRYGVKNKQAQHLGDHVRKGEKGSPVVFWHWRTDEPPRVFRRQFSLSQVAAADSSS